MPARLFAGLPGAKMQWFFGRPSLFGLPAALPWLHLGETPYHEPNLVRAMPRSAAVLLRRTLAIAESEVVARRENGAQLRAMFSRAATGEAENVRMENPPEESVASYLRFPVRIRGGAAGLAEPMRANRLGLAGPYPTTLGELSAVRERMSTGTTSWAGAEELARELVTLPTHSFVAERDREELTQLLLK